MDLETEDLRRQAREYLKKLLTVGLITWSRNPDQTITYELPRFGTLDPLEELLIASFFQTSDNSTKEAEGEGSRQPSPPLIP